MAAVCPTQSPAVMGSPPPESLQMPACHLGKTLVPLLLLRMSSGAKRRAFSIGPDMSERWCLSGPQLQKLYNCWLVGSYSRATFWLPLCCSTVRIWFTFQIQCGFAPCLLLSCEVRRASEDWLQSGKVAGLSAPYTSGHLGCQQQLQQFISLLDALFSFIK